MERPLVSRAYHQSLGALARGGGAPSAYAPGAIAVWADGPLQGDVHAAFAQALEDVRIDCRALVVQGAAACAVEALSGTHAGPLLGLGPSGRRVSLLRARWLSFDQQGRILRDEVFLDARTLVFQLSGDGGPLRERADLTGLPPDAAEPPGPAPFDALAMVEAQEAAFNRHDLAAFEESFAPKAMVRDQRAPQDLAVPRFVEARLQPLFAAFDDFRVAPTFLREGEVVASRVEATGTHRGSFPPIPVPATGRRIRLSLVELRTVSPEGITGLWIFGNGVALREQLTG